MDSPAGAFTGNSGELQPERLKCGSESQLAERFTMNAAPVLFLSLLGAVLMSGQVFGGIYVPLRCTCPKVTEVVKEPLSDIKVIEKGPHCENKEIIVTLKTQAGDGLPREVCLNPSGKQAKRLQHCLKRNKEKKQCLQKGRRERKHRRKQAQKQRQTSKRSRGTKQRALQS